LEWQAPTVIDRRYTRKKSPQRCPLRVLCVLCGASAIT